MLTSSCVTHGLGPFVFDPGKAERRNLLWSGKWANCSECIILQEIEPPPKPTDTVDSLDRFMLYARQSDVDSEVVTTFLKNAACHNKLAAVLPPQEKDNSSWHDSNKHPLSNLKLEKDSVHCSKDSLYFFYAQVEFSNTHKNMRTKSVIFIRDATYGKTMKKLADASFPRYNSGLSVGG
ncbi:hypothetical protein GBF38_013902 [Nibea albiflora]|uniref:Uncharacterized protein n=1 Tax=Nibea albiflora TaxID=240163 RepID=A0ACB7F5W1_NIBAL|nr:hypothetical protein GBF38_013902 [Nibea albiflora]